jgi:8-oxo-dGTP pyrophosphatase MutT (NUDIX family)
VNFEPKNFFIAIVDFFSILMPGAMLAYLLKDWAAAQFAIGHEILLDTPELGIVFLFSSYLLGHFIFLLSSVLDELVYDWMRRWTPWGQIVRRLAKGDPLSPRWQRNLAESVWLFDKNADSAVIQAQRIEARALQRIEAEGAINAYQWCKAKLALESPKGLSAVQRFEADSKFFRSFVVVLLALALFYALHPAEVNGFGWLAASICLLCMLPALWRYIDQRFKGTQQAYYLVITQESLKTGAPATVRRADGLTHAGGVMYCLKDGGWKFLLVQSSRDRTQWVLPKGHIEAGEEPRVTAVREVREESNYWARVVHWLGDGPVGGGSSGDRSHGDNVDGTPMVRWFLMEAVEEADQCREEDRQRHWFTLTEAIEAAQFAETKILLEMASVRLRHSATN